MMTITSRWKRSSVGAALDTAAERGEAGHSEGVKVFVVRGVYVMEWHVD